MSDLIESEDCHDPSYRRFRSEYRGKRWLAQKTLRDNHGRTKREKPRENSNSLCSLRDLRKEELVAKREQIRKEKAQKRLERAEARKETNHLLGTEAFECLSKELKPGPSKEKQKREESLKKACEELYNGKGQSAEWAEDQPTLLVKTLAKELKISAT